MSALDRTHAGSDVTTGFRLDKAGGKVFGVCQGIANYLDVDPTIVRAVFVLGTVFGFGSLILVYLVVALLAK